jgi:hypothetical protein
MASATAPTITVSPVNVGTAFGTAMADFLWTHNGHRLTHVGDIVNTVSPVVSKDAAGSVPGQAPVWYCEKDHKVFVDATNMKTAPTVTNTAGASGTTASDWIDGKRLRPAMAILQRVGQIVNAAAGQDIALGAGQMQDKNQMVSGVMTLWYDQTNNVIFCDDVS